MGLRAPRNAEVVEEGCGVSALAEVKGRGREGKKGGAGGANFYWAIKQLGQARRAEPGGR